MVIFSTIGGTTRKVAQRVADRLGDDLVFDARAAMAEPAPADTRHVILFCPTYGDEEAADDFEVLMLDYDWERLGGAAFAFCELGIYTGYENFGHGLAEMVRGILASNGLREIAPSLAVDAVPITDWDLVDRWADLVHTRLSETA